MGNIHVLTGIADVREPVGKSVEGLPKAERNHEEARAIREDLPSLLSDPCESVMTRLPRRGGMEEICTKEEAARKAERHPPESKILEDVFLPMLYDRKHAAYVRQYVMYRVSFSC